jgi:hypothetical protein
MQTVPGVMDTGRWLFDPTYNLADFLRCFGNVFVIDIREDERALERGFNRSLGAIDRAHAVINRTLLHVPFIHELLEASDVPGEHVSLADR